MTAGWQRKQIGDLCEVIAGQSPEGKFYNAEGNGVPFYQGKKDFGEKFLEAPTTWTTQTTKIAREGDILMSVRAPVGPVNFATGEACIGRGLAAIRSGAELNRDFLFYQLLHLQPEIAGREGAVFSSINKAEIEALPLAFASLTEQQRIVGILDEAFDGIAVARANAEQNLQNARALFESHLQSIFADACETGELVTLADLATDITDGDHMPPPKADSGVPFITIGNVDKNTRTIDFADTFMVSREYFDKLKANKKPQKGDVLYTVTGSFGIPVLLNEHREFCFQRHIGLVRPKPEVDSEWLYYLLLSPQIFKQANDGATGTAQKTVSLKLLRSYQVPRIPLALQRATVAKLSAINAETQRLASLYQRKLTALDELKKSLLHQAFSGAL
ncbi:MAG: type I restriction enzyme S [Gallionellaceae bacterium]|nr:MAG: type I restriction enzyme S [Gallionellaceae bacterium]